MSAAGKQYSEVERNLHTAKDRRNLDTVQEAAVSRFSVLDGQSGIFPFLVK